MFRESSSTGMPVSNRRSKQPAALLARQTLYITGLNLAHDLDTVRIEIIKKSCQLQTGTVYVVLGDLGLFKALRTVNDLKIKFMDQIAQADTEFF